MCLIVDRGISVAHQTALGGTLAQPVHRLGHADDVGFEGHRTLKARFGLLGESCLRTAARTLR
ncbi:hypothetical protein SNK04_014295 [Fusarium graminearum]